MLVVSLPWVLFSSGKCGRGVERHGLSSRVCDDGFALQRFNANHAYRKSPRQAGERIVRGAGESADGFVVAFSAKLGSGRGQWAVQLELVQSTMDGGA